MGDVTVLADQSSNDANRSQMALFFRYGDGATNFSVEKFMEMVKLTTSKKAIGLCDSFINAYQSIIFKRVSTFPLISNSSPTLLGSLHFLKPPIPQLNDKSVIPSFPYQKKFNSEIKLKKYHP